MFNINFLKKLSVFIFFVSFLGRGWAEEKEKNSFYSSLLLSNGYNVEEINKVIDGKVKPGVYYVDVYLNENFIRRENIKIYTNYKSDPTPCLSQDWWSSLGVLDEYIEPNKIEAANCPAAVKVKGEESQFDLSNLSLSLSVPQAYVDTRPRNYIDPSQWQEGTSALFINYTGNYYDADYEGSSSSKSLYYSLSSGINLGMWRLRNRSYYSYNETDSDSYSHTESLQTYAQRAVPILMSDFSFGELTTQSSQLSDFSYNGIQLKSDSRMYPNSRQGYAPEIKGIAKTASLVVIEQNGKKIYQTSVPPGPFTISDLYPTSYRGDLKVNVTGANGDTSSFTVPYISSSSALRAGKKEFSFSMGKSRDYEDDGWFADGSYSIGLSNLLTLTSDFRMAHGYYAFDSGMTLNTRYGQWGASAVYSLTDRTYNDRWINGWKYGLDYSQTFNSNTSLTLAGYHYKTDDYRELTDILDLDYLEDNKYSSSTYLQKDELSLTVSQNMKNLGYLSLSGTKRTYTNSKKSDEQYIFSYSKAFGDLSLNLNYVREYSGTSTRTKENIWTASITLPLSRSNQTISSSYTHSDGDSSADIGISGTLSDDKTLSYNISASRDMVDSGNDSGRYYLGANKRTTVGTFGANYTSGDNYTQYGLSATGGMVLHSGGINFSQTLGETFAIIHAPGAEGADVLNSFGQKVGANDYALAPNLTPYRENDVTLGGQYSPYVELLSSGEKVIPMAGAAIPVEFKTRKGYPVLINFLKEGDDPLPIGASVFDKNNAEVGIVGQNSVVYARVTDIEGVLSVRWGNNKCNLKYQLPKVDAQTPNTRFFRINSTCQ